MASERFLDAKKFSRHCKSLNISLDSSELEFYEQAGLVMPVAWVLIPQEYEDYEKSQSGNTSDEVLPAEWKALDNLVDGFTLDEPNWDDSTLVHRFERPDNANNPYLQLVVFDHAMPCPSFEIGNYAKHSYRYGKGIMQPFYHSWQAYHIYLVQKAFRQRIDWTSLLHDYLNNGKPAHIERILRVDFRNNWLATFKKWVKYFDALSFYETLVDSEEARTFDFLAAGSAFTTIEGKDFHDYKQRMEAHADSTVARYQLDTTQLFAFAIDMLHLLQEVKDDERVKLSQALTSELEHLRQLMIDGIDKSEVEIESEVGRLGGHWRQKEFRHLVSAFEVIDNAKEELEYARTKYNGRFPTMSVSDEDLEDLVKFVLDEGFFVIPHTVARMEEAFNAPGGFLRTEMYIGIKNFATGIEDMLRSIALRKSGGRVVGNTLEPLLDAIFSGQWRTSWVAERTRIYRSLPIAGKQPASPDEYVALLKVAIQDVGLSQHPDYRIFLLLYWARNLTSHFLQLITEIYFGNLLGEVVEALYDALFYSWAYARSQQWI